MKFILIFLSCIILVQSQCNGTENNNPVIYTQPKYISSVSHGARYLYSDPNDYSSFIYLAILEGSPYEMGYAFGSLFKTELTQSLEEFTGFMLSNTELLVEMLPQWLQNANFSNNEKLTLGDYYELIATQHFIPQRYVDEIQGISDATGIPTLNLTLINLIPELIRAGCSIVGIWGPASQTNDTIQLRALDWDAYAPMNNFPLITIYHSNETNASSLANFGWVGIIGSLAGYSENVGISEKFHEGVSDNTTSITGEPWMFVLRDVLEFATDLNSSMVILENANRTYAIYVGIGSRQDESFYGAEYAYATFKIYSDQNFSFPFTPAHPQMNNILYWDNSPKQTSGCFASIFEQDYGDLNAETLYQQAAPLQQTGDTIVAVYDYFNNQVYLSYSDPVNGTPAYVRPHFNLNMTFLFEISVGDVPNTETITI